MADLPKEFNVLVRVKVDEDVIGEMVSVLDELDDVMKEYDNVRGRLRDVLNRLPGAVRGDILKKGDKI